MSEALNKAQSDFIDLFVRDVTENPSAYKAQIREQPAFWAMRLIAGLDESGVMNVLTALRNERRRIARAMP